MRQIRNTLEDTLEADNNLSSLIDEKIKGVPYFTSEKEKTDFRDLIARAFLGAGISKTQKKIVHDVLVRDKPFDHLVRLQLASNAHQFALRVLAELKGDYAYFSKPESNVFNVKIPSIELWKKFKEVCSDIFPTAQTEALHISKEEHARGEQTFGYQVGDEG